MLWAFTVQFICMLFTSIGTATGQCTIAGCQDRLLGSENLILNRLEEQEQILQIICLNLSSTLMNEVGKQRCHEDEINDVGLTMEQLALVMHQNLSHKLERIDERLQEIALNVKDHDQLCRVMSSVLRRLDDRLTALGKGFVRWLEGEDRPGTKYLNTSSAFDEIVTVLAETYKNFSNTQNSSELENTDVEQTTSSCLAAVSRSEQTTQMQYKNITSSLEGVEERLLESSEAFARDIESRVELIGQHIFSGFEDLEQNLQNTIRNVSSANEKLAYERFREADEKHEQENEEDRRQLDFIHQNISTMFEEVNNAFNKTTEAFVKTIEEHDTKLQTIYQNINARFEKIYELFNEANRSFAEATEKQDQTIEQLSRNISRRFERLQADQDESFHRKLDTILQNFTDAFQRLDDRLRYADETNKGELAEHDQRQLLMYGNLSSQLVRNDEMVNETGATFASTLEKHDQRLHLVYRNLSTKSELIEKYLQLVLKQVKVNDKSPTPAGI